MNRTSPALNAVTLPSAGVFRRVTILLLAGATLAAAAVQPAAASGPATPTAVSVHYGDLNLRESEDVATLYGRISRAAEQVCGEAVLRDLRAQAASRGCQLRAVGQAVVRVNNPALTALHRDRRGDTRFG